MKDTTTITIGKKRRLGKKTTPLHSKTSTASKMRSVTIVAERAI